MIRNIPNKYTQQMLLQTLDRTQKDNYDFFYLPIDFKNNCNMGYAFINFVDSIFIVNFFYQYDGTKWAQFNSDKICKITYGRIQGKKALENNFSTMQQQSDKCSNKVRPMIADKPKPSPQYIEAIRADLVAKRNQWSEEDEHENDTMVIGYKFQRK